MTAPDYYHGLTGYPMQEGRRLFGLLSGHIPWDEWADNHIRFWDGYNAWRIVQGDHVNGVRRWWIEYWYASEGFGGWFPYLKQGTGGTHYFESREQAAHFIKGASK